MVKPISKASFSTTRIHEQRTLLGYYLIAVIGALGVLGMTQYPFHFYYPGRVLRPFDYWGGLDFGGYSQCCRYLAVLEPLGNVLMFMPFAFGLTGLLRLTHRLPWSKIALYTMLVSLCFSLSVEMMQVFQPARSPTVSDLLMNTLGGGAGVLSYKVGRMMRLRAIP